jgi:hypothetical protein
LLELGIPNMVLNQLFAHRPPLDLVLKMLAKFGIYKIDDNTTEFTILDMEQLNTLTAIKTFENEIKECYIPCKRDKYFGTLDNKALITVLRQFLKMHNYDLQSREKFIKGTKYLVYHIITKQEKDFIKKSKKPQKKEITIVFD